MKNTTKTPQTIESLKLHALKVSHRYQMALAIFGCLVIGTVFGHFLSVNIISDAQAKVINSIQVTAVSKQ
ncbi:MAG: hypothetical protein JWR59_2510 [Brevundimonas sp.]|nr:hypothetical protein [Brevundimonas sp.]